MASLIPMLAEVVIAVDLLIFLVLVLVSMV